MTDKELKKLSRAELLEIMLRLRRELDRVQEENDSLRERLSRSELVTRRAAAQLDRLYEAQFGEQYVEEEASGEGESGESESSDTEENSDSSDTSEHSEQSDKEAAP